MSITSDVQVGGDNQGSRRSRLYRVNAIVLRRRDLGETDRIVTVMTAERGKRRLVAKGSRRPSSRLAGHLEPFCATRLLVASARSLDIISQAETIESFGGLRLSETTIAVAGYLAELVDTLVPDDEANDALYELLFASYRLLSEGEDHRAVTFLHEMAMLRQLGYRPELTTCINCGASIEPVVNGLSPDGGIVCDRCLSVRPDIAPLQLNSLKLLRAADRGDVDLVYSLRIADSVWTEVGVALSRYIARIAGKESPARRVIGELRLE
ncbi:MAG TPA: DNA repair protein RecO [Thermomicrobiales bacterium]|nr:DNA repair protein RecO [Thermomicrobiales bacterium]